MNDFNALNEAGLAERGDLLGEPWAEGVTIPVAPVTPPRLEGAPEFPEPGIYFGMPEDVYHAIHAFSTSGAKTFSGSPADYWEESVLNVEREEQAQRDFFDFGHAIHTLLLEGEEAYAARYVIGLEKPRDVLETTDQIKAEIVRLGGKPTSRGYDDNSRAAKKEDWIDQLLDLDPNAQVWERMKAAFDAEHEGAEIISHKIDRKVRIGARMILAQPDLAENFTGEGWSEVSVFWFCPVTGCPMKARFDRLTMNRIVDLKSFAARLGVPIDRAVEKAIANMRYNVQHVIYDEAAGAAKALIREVGPSAVHSYDQPGDDVEAGIERCEAVTDWCLEWAKQDAPEFLFVFHKTNGAPVSRGKIMPRESMGVFGVTQRAVENLKRRFVSFCEVYGADRWLDARPIEQIDDEAIPMWATEI